MAENEDDPFGLIVDDCQYSSSQEDFLIHSKFAREDVNFAGYGGESPAGVDSDRCRTKLDGKYVAFAGGSNQVEFDGVGGDYEGLGFAKERKSSTIEVVSEAAETESRRCRVREGRETPQKGSSIEPPLKKSRVSGSSSGVLYGGNVSPLVQCCEKLGIDSEDKNKQIVVFRGGVKVENVSPLRCFGPDGVECSQDGIRRGKENRAREKLENGDDTEVIEIQDEETSESENGEMSNDVDGNEDGNEKGVENRGDGLSEEIERRRNRDFPGRKKQEFGDNTEVIEIQDEETSEPENGDGNKEGNKSRGDGSREEIERQGKQDLPRSLLGQKRLRDEETSEPENGELSNDVDNNEGGDKEGTKNRGEGSREEIERRRKRDLPRSLLGQIWGLNPKGSDGSRNGGNRKREEGNGGERPKTDETLKHLLDVLKKLATQMLCDADDGEVDIFETAKKRGLTFPRSRFLLDTHKDE